ncbi:hypothetical protein ACIOEX_01810 [Streptomyces sp. NPDC087850]|uniref:hypothetical protein n=1 Tax=Streptomyces sp. NPDC087850 TaxID=3365809 RepID=UPI0037F3927A
MTDPTTESEIRLATCPDCQGVPARDAARVGSMGTDLQFTETWHRPDCPTYLAERARLDDGARRVKEQAAWATAAFGPAHERLQAAAAAVAGDSAAAPFVAALTQLVQAQADTTGFVVLHKWVGILDQHFPPEHPNPKPQ